MNNITVGPFQQPAVLGAGVMGGRIAALLANAGYRVKLYDRPSNDAQEVANALPIAAIERLFQETPAPFSGSEAASLIIPRNYREHWAELAEHDLIIETYETLEAKQGWLTRLAPRIAKDAVILSLIGTENAHDVAKAIPAGMRTRFMAANFTTAPRYRRLVELMTTNRTEERVQNRLQQFLAHHIGVIPYIVQHHSLVHQLANFAINHAFALGEKYQLTIAEIESLTALITGNPNSGICAMADYMGSEQLALINAKIHSSCFNVALAPILQENLQFYAYQETPPKFYQSKIELPSALIHAIENADWKALTALNTAQAQFLIEYLTDYWQYLAHLASRENLTGAELDHLHRHAFAWQQLPYQLLQNFSPTEVYHHTKAMKKPYPLEDLWRRRARAKKQENTQRDAFLNQCQKIEEFSHSRLYTYQNALLIWQPKAESFDFSLSILKELEQAIQIARAKHHAVMIYHHGEQFGGLNRLEEQEKTTRYQTQVALNAVIISLRMHPQPIMLSISGTIEDYGCAIMMQADRVITTVDLAWRLRSLKYDLPPIGGTWFEWLRRLPRLSREHALIQIHTVLNLLYSSSGINSIHAARELGILRSHDRFTMTPAQLPEATRTVAEAWLGSAQPRPLRYPLYKLTPEEHQQLQEKAENSSNPERYRESLSLLAAPEQSQILSLRRFLPMEAALYNAALEQRHKTLSL